MISEEVTPPARLAALRQLHGILKAPPERSAISFSKLPQKIPRSALTSIHGSLGSGKTELVLDFLAENPELRAAWVESRISVYPISFSQKGISLHRLLFIEAGTEALWSATQALRSQLFEVLVLNTFGIEINSLLLRRLQLATEQARSVTFLLSEKPLPAWPIALQIKWNADLNLKAEGKTERRK